MEKNINSKNSNDSQGARIRYFSCILHRYMLYYWRKDFKSLYGMYKITFQMWSSKLNFECLSKIHDTYRTLTIKSVYYVEFLYLIRKLLYINRWDTWLRFALIIVFLLFFHLPNRVYFVKQYCYEMLRILIVLIKWRQNKIILGYERIFFVSNIK